MGINANTLAQGSVQAATGLGHGWPAPFTLPGYIEGNSTSIDTGDFLDANAAGTLSVAAADAAGTTLVGVAAPVSPRRQDMAPLTTGALPAAALPRQRTSPAAGAPNFANADDQDFGIFFYPLMPGMTFAAHLVDETTDVDEGTDIRADSENDIWLACGNTSTVLAAPAGDQVIYPTRAGIHLLAFSGGIGNTPFRTIMYQNPQPTTAAANALILAPGPIAETPTGGGATDTFNPVMIFIAQASIVM